MKAKTILKTAPIIDPSLLSEKQKTAVLNKFADAIDIDNPMSMEVNRIGAKQTKYLLTWLFGVDFFKKKEKQSPSSSKGLAQEILNLRDTDDCVYSFAEHVIKLCEEISKNEE